MFGGHTGPYKTSTDVFEAAYIDIPLVHKDPIFGQKLLGEIMIGHGESADKGTFTSPLSIFTNSAAAAVVGIPQGATIAEKLEIEFLQVFLGFKYKLFPGNWIEPYATTGLDVNVILSETTSAGLDTNGDGKVDASFKSVGFPGGLAGGIAPIAAEAARNGVPTGQGNFKLGWTFGAGADIKVLGPIYVGVDTRYNIMEGEKSSYATFTGKLGFNW